jgi:hypothetical protein
MWNRRSVRPDSSIVNKAMYLYRLEEYCDFLEKELHQMGYKKEENNLDYNK